jgi:hypothetical protein
MSVKIRHVYVVYMYKLCHIPWFSRLYLSAKNKKRTARDAFPVIPQHTLKKSEVYRRLKHEISKNCPPPRMVQWKKFILKV